jgi:SPP1 gp7 family putative phage head morphogenesis protein
MGTGATRRIQIPHRRATLPQADEDIRVTAPTLEAFPAEVRAERQLYRDLVSAIDHAETVIARHFRAFATAIGAKAPLLASGFMLDEYADRVDDVLGPDLTSLQAELRVSIEIVMRRAMEIGSQSGQGQLGSIAVDWDVRNPEVDRYLERHALDLVKGLDDTTRERLAVVLRRGVRNGESIQQITSAIMDTARKMSAERSRMIAQTEVMRGYNAGAVAVYRASGLVNGLRWVDGQAGACAYCQSLNGKIIRLSAAGFETTIGSTTLSAPFPPGHPGCRCAVAPVLEAV